MYNGDCFLVLPNCAAGTLIFGRNADSAALVDVPQEIQFYRPREAASGSADFFEAEKIEDDDTIGIILQKPKPGIWGGDYGANENNVCIGITFALEDVGSQLQSTDILRLALATSTTAVAAVERIGALLTAYGPNESKFSFAICDANGAWLLSSGGKLWAAYRVKNGYLRLPKDGLAVTTSIDKSSEALGDAFKTLGLWSGEGALNFAACLKASAKSIADWCGIEPIGDNDGYGLTSMFATLRAATKNGSSRASSVSVLNANGISVHWFTATPNASESVFKPFVFAPNAKISPLTRAQQDNGDHTLLHKLHAQRKPAAIADLQALEQACVQELEAYLNEHPVADEELDELMKDCVEAEVKFYR